jgi:hypothetical protein
MKLHVITQLQKSSILKIRISFNNGQKTPCLSKKKILRESQVPTVAIPTTF